MRCKKLRCPATCLVGVATLASLREEARGFADTLEELSLAHMEGAGVGPGSALHAYYVQGGEETEG